VAAIEITEVALADPVGGIRGFVDAPKPGAKIDAHLFPLAGWLLGETVAAVAAEVVVGDELVRRVPLGVSRPDLAAVYPQSDAGQAGFRTSIASLGSARQAELELELRAVLADQRRVRFAHIRGRRTAPPAVDLVSVIVPCYEQSHFLPVAIESVLSQTHPHLQLVVVDDGSHDNTSAVAKRYPGVEYVRERNRGLAEARNMGLRHADGDFVVFLDADDRLLSHALTSGLEQLQAQPECSFAAGGWRTIAFDGTPMDAAPPATVTSSPYTALLRGCFISCPAAVMYRRSALEDIGGFESAVDASADWDVYLRLASNAPVACFTEVVAEYRRHAANMTRDPGLVLSSELAVLRRHRSRARQVAGGPEARRAGIRRTRAYHGERLAQRADELARSARIRELAGTIPGLIRSRPSEVLSLVRLAIGRVKLHKRSVEADGRVDFGALRRLKPISSRVGYDRGTPVDRHYVEHFLARYAEDLRGRVLEVGGDAYTRAFGRARVTASDVLHIDDTNPLATLVGDLADERNFPTNAFDAIICTQTLQYVYDLSAAARTLHRMLKPGGVLLATLPGITQVSPDEWDDRWCWSFTKLSATRLFESVFGQANVTVESHGNVLTAISFLHGLASEELHPAELDHHDWRYPVSITVRAVKGAQPATVRGSASRQTHRRRVAGSLILLYHRVADSSIDPWGLAVRPSTFASQLELLGEWGTPLPLSDLVEALADGGPPPGSFALTFDDGYADCLETAKPILESLDLPATFFVTTATIEDTSEYWWDELARILLSAGPLPETLRLEIQGHGQAWDLGRGPVAEQEGLGDWRAWEAPPSARAVAYLDLWERLSRMREGDRSHVLDQLRRWAGEGATPLARQVMSGAGLLDLAAASGTDIGAHGVTHSSLASLAQDEQREEIFTSKATLESMLRREITSFAYPFGRQTDYDGETKAIVREAGYRYACANVRGQVGPGADLFELPRLEVHEWGTEAFRERLTSWIERRWDS
jgi:glycosyltransferase involved in cell wall biosynthesis/peptidoglycan/xylan/chitin deacetylase (PgdA/CDA1 family)